MNYSLFRAFLLFSIYYLSFAQNGTLDRNFGTNGISSVNIPLTTFDTVTTMVMHPEKFYLIAGSSGGPSQSHAILAAMNLDSSYKSSFGNNPALYPFFRYQFSTGTTNCITDIAIDPSYSIYVAIRVGSNAGIQKLTANASGVDGSFTPIQYTAAATSVAIKKIIYRAADRSIYVLLNYGGGYTYEVRKYYDNGSPDPNFYSNGVLSGIGIKPSTMVITPENTVIVAGTGMVGNFDAFAFDQHTLDGSASTFPSQRTVQIYASTSCASTCVLLANGGNLIMGGNAIGPKSEFEAAFVKINYRTGQLSGLKNNTGITTLDYNPTGETVSGFFTDQKNNLVCYGQSSDGYGFVASVKSNGYVDSTFGSNADGFFKTGILTTINGGLYSAGESGGSRLLFGGNPKSASPYMAFMKLYTDEKPIEFNMIGKEFVEMKNEYQYYIDPPLSGFNFIWSIDSDSVYVLGDSSTQYYKVYFPQSVANTYVRITCTVADGSGNVIKTVSKSVLVREEATLAEQLTPPNCNVEQTRTDRSYINSVAIENGKVLSDTSGRSDSGYEDFTSLNYDSIQIGIRFSLKVSCPSGNPQYVAAWIDVNNDGKINEEYEFLGASLTDGKDSIVRIQNGGIYPYASAGPVRLRVRSRTTKTFSASEACPTSNDDGETEDYLILLYEGDNTLAPNFITPNNDGQNDFFVIKGIDQSAEKNNLKVFDRNGNLVFEMQDYDNSWQGLNKSSKPVAAGTYYYFFTQHYNDSKRTLNDVTKGFIEIRY